MIEVLERFYVFEKIDEERAKNLIKKSRKFPVKSVTLQSQPDGYLNYVSTELRYDEEADDWESVLIPEDDAEELKSLQAGYKIYLNENFYRLISLVNSNSDILKRKRFQFLLSIVRDVLKLWRRLKYFSMKLSHCRFFQARIRM